MSITTMQEPVAAPRLAATLLPIMGVVFVAFLVIGMTMPVLPLHVHDGLGFGTFVVDLVAGSQFAASLISRPSAGGFADDSHDTHRDSGNRRWQERRLDGKVSDEQYRR